MLGIFLVPRIWLLVFTGFHLGFIVYADAVILEGKLYVLKEGLYL